MSFGINYYNVGSVLLTRHAEVDALQKLKKRDKKSHLKKLDLIVFRTNKKGDKLMLAKPCQCCLNYYKKIYIKKDIG